MSAMATGDCYEKVIMLATWNLLTYLTLGKEIGQYQRGAGGGGAPYVGIVEVGLEDLPALGNWAAVHLFDS